MSFRVMTFAADEFRVANGSARRQTTAGYQRLNESVRDPTLCVSDGPTTKRQQIVVFDPFSGQVP